MKTSLKKHLLSAVTPFYALLLKGGGVFSAFILSYLVASYTGVDGAGVYYFCFTIFMLISAISRIGTDQSIVKYVARLKYRFQIVNSLYGISSLVFIISCTFVLTLNLTLFVMSEYNYINRDIYLNLMYSSPTIVFTSFMFVFSNYLQALSKAKSYVFFVSLMCPTLTCLFAIIFETKTAFGLLQANMFSSLITSLCCLYYLKKSIQIKWRLTKVKNKETIHIVKNSFSYMIIAFFLLFNQWYPTLFIGFFGDVSEVGLFSIGQKVALVFSSLSVVIGAIYAPEFMKASSDYELLGRLILKSIFLLVFMGGSGGIMLLLFSDNIFSIFGKEFASVAVFFPKLLLVQFIMLFTVLLGWVMLSLELQKKLTYIVASMSLCNVTLFTLFLYGMEYNIINSICYSLLCSSTIQLLTQIHLIRGKVNRCNFDG